jgi:cytidine diphosphoramidate kinase
MVVWIIGLSGAGKTTLANEVVANIRSSQSNVVLIDGDAIREVFGNELGHTLEDRRKNADRICGLGRFLESQGMTVVCAVLSIFHESQDWNRKNLKEYYEVFIDTSMEDLIERDGKSLYKKALNGELKDVVGVDLEFKPPKKPDLIIDNSKGKEHLMSFVEKIAEQARKS